ncbi:interleukin-1 beta [Anabas testudineus]|uniref:Interleukin-1 n=1 Tax=Anabas testudineus TaxID=64144 RepID=A0A3Q1IDK3_ANATE|nr:interleukin-1 beta [Anabas testudineus]
MGDFDLSQALDCPLDSDVTTIESNFFNETDVQNEIITVEEGLELVVSRNRRTLKIVANLVLAVSKMSKTKTCCNLDLSEDELCSAIMDTVTDETIVETVNNSCTGKPERVFRRLNSVRECTLSDSSQKAVYCTTVGDVKLQAITLTGGNSDRRVGFKLSKGVFGSGDNGSLTVFLSIKNTNYHITCSMDDEKAVINLEECSEEQLASDKNVNRFLFYKVCTGQCLTTFESVKCPGWFISTSFKEDQPLEMCKEKGSQRLTNFRMS